MVRVWKEGMARARVMVRVWKEGYGMARARAMARVMVRG